MSASIQLADEIIKMQACAAPCELLMHHLTIEAGACTLPLDWMPQRSLLIGLVYAISAL